MIAKREFNPELSAFSNLALDLVDFRDRIRPAARDIALMDASRTYQRHSAEDWEDARRQIYTEINGAQQAAEQVEAASPAQDSVEEGYSSKEIPAETDSETAAPEQTMAAEAEPEVEAVAEPETETVAEPEVEAAEPAAEVKEDSKPKKDE